MDNDVWRERAQVPRLPVVLYSGLDSLGTLILRYLQSVTHVKFGDVICSIILTLMQNDNYCNDVC